MPLRILKALLLGIANNKLNKPLGLPKHSYFAYYRKSIRSTMIDWNYSLEEIKVLVRALNFGECNNLFRSNTAAWQNNRVIYPGGPKYVQTSDKAFTSIILHLDNTTIKILTTGAAIKVQELYQFLNQKILSEQLPTLCALSQGDRLPRFFKRQLHKTANMTYKAYANQRLWKSHEKKYIKHFGILVGRVPLRKR